MSARDILLEDCVRELAEINAATRVIRKQVRARLFRAEDFQRAMSGIVQRREVIHARLGRLGHAPERGRS